MLFVNLAQGKTLSFLLSYIRNDLATSSFVLTKYLPLLIIVLIIDWLYFPILEFWLVSNTGLLSYIVKVFHFIMPFGLIILLAGNDQYRWRKKNRTLFSQVFAGFQLLYISKIIGLIGLLLFTIFGGIVDWIAEMEWLPWRFVIATLLSLIPLILLPYGILFNRYRYRIRKIDIPIENLPKQLDGLKVVQISDIHSGSFTENDGFEKGIQMINDLKPDIILFTGDLVNNRAIEFEPFIETFKKLEATHGVYSVLGNHDYGDYVSWGSPEAKKRNLLRLIEMQRSMNWDILLNEHRIISVDDSRIAIIGVENYSAKLRFPKYGKLKEATTGIESADLKLLLSHDPSHWRYEVIPAFSDIDITFSGHTHGMQFGIKIGNWEWSPIKYVYSEWAGRYQEGKQYLYVNRGFGVLGYPGRVGILPEITFVKIVGV